MGEIGMLVLETVVGIGREYAGGKAIKAMARDLHVSRKAIRKAIRVPEGNLRLAETSISSSHTTTLRAGTTVSMDAPVF
ncbi:hypothetical protein [Sphingopyxis bauzanensis]|nr:hypothetical protein [Sphingopyxis bauzanensis]GGJ45728.1 hypothetical protein GCM10011393_14750 [Sphingopyxis bauzanensis]